MPIDLKLRANQVWGYLALTLGGLLSIVQFFALISPWRLNLRVFLLLVVLAAYLIRIGVRSIRLAREMEAGREVRKLSEDLRAVWARCRDVLSTPGTLRTVLLVVFGLLHVIAGLGSFLFVGTVTFAVGHYLGLGPAGLPVMVFCLLGAVFSVRMMIRPSSEAYHAAADWDMILGAFCLLATLTGYGFYMVRPILAVTLLGMGGVLMLSSSADKRNRSKDVS